MCGNILCVFNCHAFEIKYKELLLGTVMSYKITTPLITSIKLKLPSWGLENQGMFSICIYRGSGLLSTNYHLEQLGRKRNHSEWLCNVSGEAADEGNETIHTQLRRGRGLRGRGEKEKNHLLHDFGVSFIHFWSFSLSFFFFSSMISPTYSQKNH